MVTISCRHFLQALIDTSLIFAASRKSEAYKVDGYIKKITPLWEFITNGRII
jgi:hypothetical protein